MTEHQATLLLHVIGAGIMIGITFFSLVLTIRRPLTIEEIKKLSFIRSAGVYVAFFQLLTGLHLFQHHYTQFAHSYIFWTKLGLFFIDGIIAEKLIKAKMDRALQDNAIDKMAGKTLAIQALTSALVVLLIVTLGFFLEQGYGY